VRAVALTISFFALALPASAGAQVLTLNCQYEITYDMKLLTKTLETGGFPAIIYINEVPGVARIETNSGRFVYVGGFDEQELTGDCERVDGTAKCYAREEAKARIRAAGRKISHYLPKDIAVMANALLLQEPEPFITKARDVIAGGPREIHAAGSIDAVSTALGIPY
jgi:hypothetical protein